jgi:hypothetical protein
LLLDLFRNVLNKFFDAIRGPEQLGPCRQQPHFHHFPEEISRDADFPFQRILNAPAGLVDPEGHLFPRFENVCEKEAKHPLQAGDRTVAGGLYSHRESFLRKPFPLLPYADHYALQRPLLRAQHTWHEDPYQHTQNNVPSSHGAFLMMKLNEGFPNVAYVSCGV